MRTSFNRLWNWLSFLIALALGVVVLFDIVGFLFFTIFGWPGHPDMVIWPVPL